METVIFGQWWRSHQSLACKGLCILRFCVMSWKDESEPNIKCCLGTTVGLFQRFTTVQNFGHNWRRTDGIRVEYFPGFTTLQLVQEVQKFMNKMSDPDQFQGQIIFMSMFNDIILGIKVNETECIDNSTLVSLFAKRFPAGRWSFLGPGSETKWYSFCLQRKTTRRMGHSRWNDDDQIQRKWTPSFPSHESHWLEERSKAKGVENYRYTCVQMVIRLKMFFAQFFLPISSVSTEQSQMCVRNTVFVKQERRDPYRQDNLTHCSSQQDYWWQHLHLRLKFLYKNFFAKVQRTSGKASTTRSIEKDVYWSRIPENSWSRTVLHDKAHWRVLTICSASDMSRVYFTTRWQINWPERLDSREHQNWTRVRSHNQLFAR